MDYAIQILKAARDLIADPKNWMQGAYASNQDGEAVFGNDPKAVCWCSVGALQKFADNHEVADDLAHLICGNDYLAGLNDRCSHAEILAEWDKGIEKLEKLKARRAGEAV